MERKPPNEIQRRWKGSMQDGNPRQYEAKWWGDREQIRTALAGSETQNGTVLENAKNVARIYRQAPL
jgi:hypothetical protein